MSDASSTSPSKETDKEVKASIRSYDVGVLMAQTRKLASDYRKQTGQALPVTEELARFDAISILGLGQSDQLEGVDAISKPQTGVETEQYLIKGRVIFKAGKARQKLGKLGLQGLWNHLLMVIYDAEYCPTQIYKVKRVTIEKELENLSSDKRGSMTVAKYKAIGELIWQNSDSETSEYSEKGDSQPVLSIKPSTLKLSKH
ncbi:MAG: hypothetical protein Q9M92_06155 [Enterobacterales bacterium]|nr:hypothetical protein [Enterobacterales bacterium]